jgi:hypothetical protein
MSRPPRREAVAGPRGGKAIDQWRAPPTAQAGCPAYGEPIGAKKFLFPPFLRNFSSKAKIGLVGSVVGNDDGRRGARWPIDGMPRADILLV